MAKGALRVKDTGGPVYARRHVVVHGSTVSAPRRGRPLRRLGAALGIAGLATALVRLARGRQEGTGPARPGSFDTWPPVAPAPQRHPGP